MTIAVTDADRKAAEELRAALADLSGFWHLPGDNGPLCLAMARHRERCELQLLDKLSHSTLRASANHDATAAVGFEGRVRQPRTGALGR